MALIKCHFEGKDCEFDESVLTPFREEIDNEVEHTIATGWKLGDVTVQRSVNMVLKKPAVFAEAVAASIG